MSNKISEQYIFNAYEAYYASVVFENGFAELNLTIMENEEYMKLAGFPYEVCVDQLCLEFGFSLDDDRAYDNMGGWFTRTMHDAVDDGEDLTGEELHDLCASAVRKAIEEDRFDTRKRDRME